MVAWLLLVLYKLNNVLENKEKSWRNRQWQNGGNGKKECRNSIQSGSKIEFVSQSVEKVIDIK